MSKMPFINNDNKHIYWPIWMMFNIHGQYGIIMFDVTARLTYKNVPTWYHDLCQLVLWYFFIMNLYCFLMYFYMDFYSVCANIPIVVCGDKVDVKNRQVKAKQLSFHRKKNLQYYEISAKINYNVEKHFLHLSRKLLGNASRNE